MPARSSQDLWFTWDETCRHIYAVLRSWPIAAADLTAMLRSGKVGAEAWYVHDDQTYMQEVPAAFWSKIRIGQPWPVKDSLGWRTTEPLWSDYPWLRCRPEMYLPRAAVIRTWPIPSAEEPASPPKRRGRRPKHDWPVEALMELLRQVADPQKIAELGSDSDFADHFCQLFMDRYDEQLELSHVRKLVGNALRQFRK